jgi:hypothetical protein
MRLVKVSGIQFTKSSYSPRDKFCVGVAFKGDKVLLVNTKSCGPVVHFTFDEWDAFVKGVKDGEFDLNNCELK